MTQDGSIPLGDEQATATAPPASKGVLVHCWRRQGIGDGIWHWYLNEGDKIVVCGMDHEACEAAARGMGYEITEADNGTAQG